MTQASAYPLTWPFGRPRTPRPIKSQFRTQLPGALKNVEKSLIDFGKDSGKPVTNFLISSNASLGVSKPEDPGVAVYFTWDETEVCIAVDRYKNLACNLQAIHHILEARRVELRHGGLQIVRATFKGFTALPAPRGHQHWTARLGLPITATETDIRQAAKALAKKHHPDGGSEPDSEKMKEINQARDDALKDIKQTEGT